MQDVNSAIAVHNNLQGAIVTTSDRGSMRLQYPFNCSFIFLHVHEKGLLTFLNALQTSHERKTISSCCLNLFHVFEKPFRKEKRIHEFFWWRCTWRAPKHEWGFKQSGQQASMIAMRNQWMQGPHGSNCVKGMFPISKGNSLFSWHV